MEYVLSVDEMRECDKKSIDVYGIPGIVLMENAAIEAYRIMTERGFRDAVVVCGKGNNGGDGWALARHIMNGGGSVRVYYTGIPKEGTPAYMNYKTAEKMRIEKYGIGKLSLEEQEGICIVDAVLGTGFSGELAPEYEKAVKRINQLKRAGNFVLSLDIPSGLSGETGRKSVCVNADLCVTFGAYKKGLVQNDGAEYFGKTVVRNVSIPPELLISDTALFRTPVIRKRKIGRHKYDNGTVTVIGGSRLYKGAPVLSAKAALKSGAGMVYTVVPPDFGKLPAGSEIIFRTLPECLAGTPAGKMNKVLDEIMKSDALVIGCGAGKGWALPDALVEALVGFPGKIVADADGIDPVLSLHKRTRLKNIIITPHAGEFAAAGGMRSPDMLQDLRRFSIKNGLPVILKSGLAYAAFPNGKVYISAYGTPWMAKAGTGDALSGVLASFLAQGYSMLDASNIALYLIGATAVRLAGRKGMLGITAASIIEGFGMTGNEIIEK